MHKDSRYLAVKQALENKEVIYFNDIFQRLPKSIVAKDTGIGIKRMNSLCKDARKILLGDALLLANLLDVNPLLITDIVARQLGYEMPFLISHSA